MTKKQKDDNPKRKKGQKKKSPDDPLVTEYWTDPVNNLFLVTSANKVLNWGGESLVSHLTKPYDDSPDYVLRMLR